MFGDVLATKMRERDISVRGLAAAWRPQNVESGRRNIYKYLHGQHPSERIVAELAAALDVPVEELSSADDADEEVDQLEILADLVAQLQRVVESQTAKRKRAAA